MYITEVHGNMPCSSNWNIPEYGTTPHYIPTTDEEMKEDECGDIVPGHMTHMHSVPSGQRYAMLNYHNKLFERCNGGNVRVANDEDECMDEYHANDNTPLPKLVVTKNGKQ